MRNFIYLFSVVFLVVSLSGCASMRKNNAREAHINRAVKGYVYKQSLDTVFPESRKILFEHGFQTRDSDGKTLETEWGHDGSSEVRYLVVVQPSQGGNQVHFMKNVLSEGQSRPTVSRDLDMEWLLIRRLDYEYTRQIQAEADEVASRTN